MSHNCGNGWLGSSSSSNSRDAGPSSTGSVVPTTSSSLFSYSNRLSTWRIACSRARFLSLLLMTVHGASAVPLEVPLAVLALARLLQRHHPGAARVEVLHEPLDGAALAGRVAPLEEHHQPLAGVLDPVLQLEQLDLHQPLLALVVLAVHPLRVRVALAPGVDRFAVDGDQHGIVVGLV